MPYDWGLSHFSSTLVNDRMENGPESKMTGECVSPPALGGTVTLLFHSPHSLSDTLSLGDPDSLKTLTGSDSSLVAFSTLAGPGSITYPCLLSGPGLDHTIQPLLMADT